MTDKVFIRAKRIRDEIDELDHAIAFIEQECIEGLYKLPLVPFDDQTFHTIQIYLFEEADNLRLTNRILAALKNERDLLKAEYDEL